MGSDNVAPTVDRTTQSDQPLLDALARNQHGVKVALELTQALCATLDFRDILSTVVRSLAELARVERCSLVIVRDQSDVGYVVAASDDKDLRDRPIELGRYPEIQSAMHTGEVLIIEDASTHPLLDVVRTELSRRALRWLAVVPILFEGKPMGVFFLRNPTPVALSDHDLSLTRTVVNATAVALRNARILQSLRDQTQQITVARFEAERRMKALMRYSDFFHSTADGIIVIDTDAQILFSNPRAEEITGLSSAELARSALSDLLDPRDHARLDEIRAGIGGGVFPTMVDLAARRFRGSASERRILSVSFSPVLREEGGAILVSFRDVTDDRATAAELRKTKEFLERVIDSSADAIISADAGGVIRLFNSAAERLYGYDAEDIVGSMSALDLYPEGVAREIMQLIQGPDHGGPGRIHAYRTTALAKDRTAVPVLLSAALIFEDEALIGSVGILTDLRDRLRMEAQLTEAQDELRAREKHALVAELAGAAAHELNQPLTSIFGYAELIRRRAEDPPSIHSAVTILLGEAERMAEIVRKIGRITRYETKAYVGSSKILDLERASDEDPHRELR